VRNITEWEGDMKISMEGWRRRAGWWGISERDLSKLEVSDNSPSIYSSTETYLYRNDNGEVVVENKTPNLGLNGHYLARMTLTTKDIAALARVAFQGKPFEEIASLLSKPRRKKKAKSRAR
jgi:hypothetical protein